MEQVCVVATLIVYYIITPSTIIFIMHLLHTPSRAEERATTSYHSGLRSTTGKRVLPLWVLLCDIFDCLLHSELGVWIEWL